ncbi:hypothetical protein PEPS_01070 [Persicobacter psychrovividus]|uniref:Uncharacterized protein n=1 Tax=Persicobacter psychrovividus TaxID=387638 RepID=A0ABN6L929_9BACT|nr:hypothetical protein PEPS_01060 [Persicobacter psychrovividus]BDC97826.1 hypothetical protein PEPS_01070 [Persicobacter psychrovividus]
MLVKVLAGISSKIPVINFANVFIKLFIILLFCVFTYCLHYKCTRLILLNSYVYQIFKSAHSLTAQVKLSISQTSLFY